VQLELAAGVADPTEGESVEDPGVGAPVSPGLGVSAPGESVLDESEALGLAESVTNPVADGGPGSPAPGVLQPARDKAQAVAQAASAHVLSARLGR
jgi:hypothetical protein